MRKFLMTMVLAFSWALVHGQTYYSSYKTMTCDWNAESKKFDAGCANADEATMMKLNAEKTMFNHTTSSITSAYYVDSHEYDSDYDVDMYYVTNDVGNKYLFIVDEKNSQLRIMGNMGADDAYLKTYFLKKIWSE